MENENVNLDHSEEVVQEEQETQAQADERNAKVSLSTKETKEVLRLIFAFVKILKEAKENDGQIAATDLALLVNLFPHVGDAIDGIDKVGAELKDLDSAEIKDLLVYTGAQLTGVISEAKEELVEKALAAGLAVVELVQVIVENKK